ncbi:Elongation factor Ts [Mycoplasmopsis maculosa]|uniref:Elongation factor Ts n=1 Tax=Mycoplasmopsis maculosa TaxID=114885 RepID=A0A449B445_9BACT|nr:translation elongation factor Ts [Mycoplasmopsis maculosa]VEU75374.1 Elongation factor Ts [Mycoplasmopsis maculosa]
MDKMNLIKELRERTNAGMIDCKKALEESDWDIEKAITWLKSSGKIKAAKKAGRVSAEGLVAVAGDEKLTVIVELNCETDFVAKNDDFKKLIDVIAKTIIANPTVADVQAVLALNAKGKNESVNDLIEEATAKIGEKIELRRFEVIKAEEGETVASFAHVTGQIAAVVKVKGSDVESTRNVAMHASAMKPEFMFASEIPAEKLAQFEAEFVVPANFDKKPENIQKMIREGSLAKKIAEVTLEEQAFMMDDSKSIKQYLKEHKNEMVKAIRYGVGEGIEKTEVDFASEVAAAMNGQ